MSKIMNKRNGIIVSLAVVFIIIAVVVSTSFTQAMTLDEAKEIAQKHVPSTAKYITSEEEDKTFEVCFHDDEREEGYEVEVNKETKEVKKVETQMDNDLGSEKVKLKESDIKTIIENRFKGVTSVTVILTKDNGLYEYEASFKSNEFYGDADVNADTGVILDSVIKYGTATTIPIDDTIESELLSYEEAKDAAIEKAGGGTVRDIDLDRDGEKYFYEVELHKDGMEYDYIVNAKSGEVTLENEHECYFDHHHDDDHYDDPDEYDDLENHHDNRTDVLPDTNNSSNDNDLITEEKAKEIVLAKVPGATFAELKLENDDGVYVYEITAHADGYEYEFEINASSGVITSWDKDSIDDDHDDEWDD